jgi:hypothetical protein
MLSACGDLQNVQNAAGSVMPPAISIMVYPPSEKPAAPMRFDSIEAQIQRQRESRGTPSVRTGLRLSRKGVGSCQPALWGFLHRR